MEGGPGIGELIGPCNGRESLELLDRKSARGAIQLQRKRSVRFPRHFPICFDFDRASQSGGNKAEVKVTALQSGGPLGGHNPRPHLARYGGGSKLIWRSLPVSPMMKGA